MQVGHRREGVLLKATTGRNILGGLNTLTSQEQAQAAWYVRIELILKLQLWSIHRKRRNLQRKGMRPEKEKTCRMKGPHCMMSRQPCINITEQTTQWYAAISSVRLSLEIAI
jgi:hypothetical protein